VPFTWSPDGQQLTFAAGPEGNQALYVINVDGTNQIRLTDVTFEHITDIVWYSSKEKN
jgi:Tol biopolymer transport system component